MCRANFPAAGTLLMAIGLGGCAHLCHKYPATHTVTRSKTEILASDFGTPFPFPAAGQTHYVYFRDGTGPDRHPSVVVLPELFALSAECLDLAERLNDKGYAVYVPVLWGHPEDDPCKMGTAIADLIEFATHRDSWHPFFSEHKAQGINKWLRALCRDRVASDRHPIGVIGQCLTGSFPIALLDGSVPQIQAAVISQPSLPFFAFTPEARRSLGLSREEISAARENVRLHEIPILGFRFEHDSISKPERFETLQEIFCPWFCNQELRAKDYHERDGLPCNAHPVLTHGYQDSRPSDPQPATFIAYQTLLHYLEVRLKSDPPGPFHCPPRR